MTVGFNTLQIGDTVELKGPLGSFIWNGKGVVTWRGQTRRLKEVGLVCGGSGAHRSFVEIPRLQVDSALSYRFKASHQ